MISGDVSHTSVSDNLNALDDSVAHPLIGRLRDLSEIQDERCSHVLDFLWSENCFASETGCEEFARESEHQPARYHFDLGRIRPEVLQKCMQYLE